MEFKNQKEKKQDESILPNNLIINKTSSNITLDDVVLDCETREKIEELLLISSRRERLLYYWNLSLKGLNVINLKGPPGCGKTVTAYAIANSLNKTVIEMDVSTIMSKYYGETPKNLRNIFQRAKEMDAVIILNEADSLFRKRVVEDTSTIASSENTNKNMLFNLLDTHEGLVILTTNLSKEYDKAFKSRMESIEFNLPDYEARLKLWQLYLKNIPSEDNIDYSLLADRSKDLTGRDITKCIRNAVLSAEMNNDTKLLTRDLCNAIKDTKTAISNEDVDYLNNKATPANNTIILT